MKRVAVIGAGAAGLATARHLLARHFDVVVYEAGSRIGGLWVYENDNGLSLAYRSLHLNSEAAVTAYAEHPFPADAPLYPDHAQVCEYLEGYAKRFALMPHIRLSTRVASVRREGSGDQPGAWLVQTEAGDSERFDAVVVASGHQSIPTHPDWRAQFTGEYLHSHAYRVPDPFAGKRVLVVGMGNSAVDIAADICTVTRSTTLSARSPVLVMPRMMFGVPTSRVLARLEKPWMPWPVARRIRELLTRVVHGRMEDWGFVTPTTRTHPTSHPNLISQMAWHRITAKPGIRSVEGQEVRFADGSAATYDTVIAATGYEVDLPFLPPEMHPLRGSGIDLFMRVVPPEVPGLFFIGLFNVSGGGNIRMMGQQAEWLAELLAGVATLPTPAEMRASIARTQAEMGRRYPGSKRYALELDPRLYNPALAAERRRGRSQSQSQSQKAER